MNYEFLAELKETIKWAAMATVAIICCCWLFFDFHIVNRTKRLLGMQHPRIVIIDEGAFATYEKLIAPIAKQKRVPIGIMVESWAIGAKGRLSRDYLAKTSSECVIGLRHIKKTDPDLQNKTKLKERLLKEKAILDKAKIKAKYAIYPWDGNNVKYMKPLVRGIWSGAITKNSRPIANGAKMDKHQIYGYNIGYAKPIKFEEIALFADRVNQVDGLGVLMIRSYNKHFTAAARKELERGIDYILDLGVEIGQLAMSN